MDNGEQILKHILKSGGLTDEEIEQRIKESDELPYPLANLTGTEPVPVEQRIKKQFGFVILKTCNMQCPFCIWDSAPRNNKEMVTPEFFEEVVIKMKNEGFNFVGLIGGEVGLHPNFRELIDILVKHEIGFTLVTNSKEWKRYKFLIKDKKIRKYFDSIAFSLDGTEEVHDRCRGKGSYKKVLEALEYFHKHKQSFTIKMVLRRDNYQDIMHVFSFAEKYKCKFEAFDCTNTSDFWLTKIELEGVRKIMEENKKRLEEFKEKWAIHTLYDWRSEPTYVCKDFYSRDFQIYPDGKVGYCCGGLQDDTPLGNIKTDSVQEILLKKIDMSLFLINSIYPILNRELPFSMRDSCALCRQCMKCKR